MSWAEAMDKALGSVGSDYVNGLNRAVSSAAVASVACRRAPRPLEMGHALRTFIQEVRQSTRRKPWAPASNSLPTTLAVEPRWRRAEAAAPSGQLRSESWMAM